MSVDKNLSEKKTNQEKEESKEIYIHPNYKKSANLIYLSGALGIGNLIWKYETFDSGLKISIAVIVFFYIFGIGYVVSRGNDWIKYILLILQIVGLLGIPSVIGDLKDDPIVGINNIVQIILQIWALVLLFKIPKPDLENS